MSTGGIRSPNVSCPLCDVRCEMYLALTRLPNGRFRSAVVCRVKWFGPADAIPLAMNAEATRANQLEKRLIAFAGAILSLSAKLPKSPQGRHICTQILRSGTAAAANYGEARGAESRADFIHKLKVVFRNLTKLRSGLRSSRKVPCFRRKTQSALSRKTANFAGSLRRPSRRLGVRRSDGESYQWVIG